MLRKFLTAILAVGTLALLSNCTDYRDASLKRRLPAVSSSLRPVPHPVVDSLNPQEATIRYAGALNTANRRIVAGRKQEQQVRDDYARPH